MKKSPNLRRAAWILATTVFAASQSHAARVADDLLVFYDFEEGAGAQVLDHAPGPALDLTISDLGGVSWGSGYLSMNVGAGNTIVESSAPAPKIVNAMLATSALTIEAWVRPANTTQSGPTRIVTLSSNPSLRNFTLGQAGNEYDQRFRTTATSVNGLPSLSSGSGSLTTGLQHVVYTRNAAGDEIFYVDNVLVASGTRLGDPSNWDASYHFGLGNEFTLDRGWQGDLFLVALYSEALGSAGVAQNFLAGPNASVPEPSTGLLVGFGVACFGIRRRMRSTSCAA